MSFTATCPSCGSRLRLLDKYQGRQIQCPDCGHPYVAGQGQAKKLVVLDDPEPEYSGPQVQCYDCRYSFPVPEAEVMTVKVGHSYGTHTLSLFSGSSASSHYAKVDLCRRCAKRRRDLAFLETVRNLVILFSVCLGLLAGFGSESVWVGVTAWLLPSLVGIVLLQVKIDRVARS